MSTYPLDCNHFVNKVLPSKSLSGDPAALYVALDYLTLSQIPQEIHELTANTGFFLFMKQNIFNINKIMITVFTGWSKKTSYFVFRLTFLFLNIFSKCLHNIVAKQQEILPYEFPVCTTKTSPAMVIESQVSDFCQASKQPFFCRRFLKRPTNTHPQHQLVDTLIALRVPVLIQGVLLDILIELFIWKLKCMGCYGPDFCCQGQS